MNENKIAQFSMKRPGDKKNAQVGGILVLFKSIIISDWNNKTLKLFDLSCVYQSSVDSKHYSNGITAVEGDCFATCGMDTAVHLWTVHGKTIVTEDISYDVDDFSDGIHYNGTYYCVLHNTDNAITVLDTQGRQVRKIVRKEAFGKEIEFGEDIHMDRTTHNIYVPCWTNNKGVVCLSVHGDVLWFTPLEGALGGITEIDGVICVSDYDKGHCVHMVSKSGEYKGKLLDKDILKDRQPFYMSYVADAKKIYFSLYNSDVICFMSL